MIEKISHMYFLGSETLGNESFIFNNNNTTDLSECVNNNFVIENLILLCFEEAIRVFEQCSYSVN